jgi:hypothetical protein
MAFSRRNRVLLLKFAPRERGPAEFDLKKIASELSDGLKGKEATCCG